jgi:hypothetical protein
MELVVTKERLEDLGASNYTAQPICKVTALFSFHQPKAKQKPELPIPISTIPISQPSSTSDLRALLKW